MVVARLPQWCSPPPIRSENVIFLVLTLCHWGVVSEGNRQLVTLKRRTVSKQTDLMWPHCGGSHERW